MNKQLRQLLKEQESYERKKRDRKEKELRLPSDYVCNQCGRFAGSMIIEWRITKNSVMCKRCFLELQDSQKKGWNELNQAEKIELVFSVVFQHEQIFRKICRFDDDIFDVAVLDKIENFVANYDPEKCILYSYLKSVVGWYAFKAANLRAKCNGREIKESDIVNEEISSSVCQSYCNDQISVDELLESLHPFDRWLIEQHVINGWSQEELAKASKRSKATINVWMAKVCDKLRREYATQE